MSNEKQFESLSLKFLKFFSLWITWILKTFSQKKDKNRKFEELLNWRKALIYSDFL